MVNYDVTIYTSVKELSDAIELIDNAIAIKVIPLIEDGRPKYLLAQIPTALTTSGTTTSDYVDALNWLCLGYSYKNIVLKNTDDAESLKYKILTYAYRDGIEFEEVPETSLAKGNIAQITLQFPYDAVVVKVIDDSGNASYRIDYAATKGGG